MEHRPAGQGDDPLTRAVGARPRATWSTTDVVVADRAGPFTGEIRHVAS